MAGIDHGGRLSLARARWPDAPGPWIDLSTGINPWSYPVGDPDHRAWARLPDPAALAALEAVMARAFGVASDRVAACGGSETALRLLPLLFPVGVRVGIAGPTYGSHADAWHGAIMAPLATLIARLDTVDVLVVVRPNNPDGALADEALLGDAARALAARGGALVLDEAFADALPGASLAARDWAAGAIILRSFGKTYGLAGLRLGAVIAPAAMAARLRRTLGDWPVSEPAIAIGARAYADDVWLAATRDRLAEAARRLEGLLGDLGFMSGGACPLFRLVEHDRAGVLHDRLARHGIWTRIFADNPHWLRLGLPGSPAAWTRLAAALEDFEQ